MLYDPTIGDATDRLLVLAIFLMITCVLSFTSLRWVWRQIRRPRAVGGYAGKGHVVKQCLAPPRSDQRHRGKRWNSCRLMRGT